MSLVAFALRTAFKETLKGRTLAGDRVVDSPLEPLDDILAENAPAKPYIAIFTGDTSKSPDGRETAKTPGEIEMTVQVYCPPEVAIGDIRVSGSAVAAVIDAVERQIDRAIAVEDNAWTKLLRRLAHHISNISSRPYQMQTENGVRIPMREMTYTCKVVADPSFDLTELKVDTVWLDLDTAMRAHAGLAPLADFFRDLALRPDGLTDMRALQARLGATEVEMRNMGLSGDLIPDDPPPVVQDIVIEAQP